MLHATSFLVLTLPSCAEPQYQTSMCVILFNSIHLVHFLHRACAIYQLAHVRIRCLVGNNERQQGYGLTRPCGHLKQAVALSTLPASRIKSLLQARHVLAAKPQARLGYDMVRAVWRKTQGVHGQRSWAGYWCGAIGAIGAGLLQHGR